MALQKQKVPKTETIIKRPNPLLDVGVFNQNLGSNKQMNMLLPEVKRKKGIDDMDKYQATTSLAPRKTVTTHDYYIGEGGYQT